MNEGRNEKNKQKMKINSWFGKEKKQVGEGLVKLNHEGVDLSGLVSSKHVIQIFHITIAFLYILLKLIYIKVYI